MKNIYNSSNGFSIVHTALIIVILGIIGGTGFYVYNSQKETKKLLDNTSQNSVTDSQSKKKVADTELTNTTDKISFETSIDSADKQKIQSQIAEPMLFYYKEALKIELEQIAIKKNENMMNSADARYIMNYFSKNEPGSALSASFGYNNKIETWVPQLCDDGGCNEYPAVVKDKFPANYSAFVACDAANKAGDKAKASTLNCLTI